MNRYQPTMHRATFGLFATAMTALTLALAVVVPANMDMSAQQERLLAATSAASQVAHDTTAHAKQQG